MIARTVFTTSLSVLIFACTQSPAHVVMHNDPASISAAQHNPFTISVEEGDNLYNLAKKHSTTTKELIRSNGLTAPYHLKIGQDLRVPRPQFHIVQAKETLSSISRSYKTSISIIASANGLTAPYAIFPGQKLSLHTHDSAAAKNAAGTVTVTSTKLAPIPLHKTPPASSAEASLPTPHLKSSSKMQHTPDVTALNAQGKEFMPLPRFFKAKAAPISAETEMASASFMPVPRMRPFATATRVDTTSDIVAKKPENEAKLETVTIATPHKKPEVTTNKEATNSHVRGFGFIWPAKGTISSIFGPKDNGLYNDGINISAPQGTEVLAAESGEVVYAGNELRGYGNLILIKHAGGYLSAYAHMDDMLVSKGDHVAKGKKIAHIGSTGHVSSPQLHFSIRKGKKAIDPRKHLPQKLANK